MKRIQLLDLFVLLSSTAFAEVNLESLLPDTLKYNALAVAQPPVEYAGFDLFTLIDGGAEIYFEYGFGKALNVAYLVNDVSRMEVQIYEMSDVGAAYGIFSHSKVITCDVSQENSALFILSEYFSMIQKDKFFIVISWSDALPELSELATVLGDEIAGNIEVSGPLPEIVSQRLKEGYSHGQIKYIRGTIALSAAYFFSHKDPFNVREAVCTEDGEGKTILFWYDTPEKASMAFNKAREDFSVSKRFVSYRESGENLLFTDKRGRKIQIGNEMNQIMAEISSVNEEGEVISLPDGF